MPDLPSGTVTFLFTDIEGSTALWERDRATMRAAVDRQLTILQSLIAAHHGVLYKTIGDGTQAAFASAEEALQAALASQRALLAEAWGEPPGPVRVRMVLHAGEAIPDTCGDYLAAPLNRLSRLLSAGHGGQILLSQTVQQLTRGALPTGTTLQDLGEHRLRDLLEPERVFQLLHSDLPHDLPALKTLETRANNLPRQPTLFVGRERELGEVIALLRRQDVQLLTLTGSGGTGKTRLALQAAAQLLDDFGDGVFFVPLAPVADPALVSSAIAGTLGIREAAGRPLPDRLRDFLSDKQLLLVLDNCEHLRGAAPWVAELLRLSPRLKVLATGRAPLRVQAEREYAVPPLALPRRHPPPPREQAVQSEAVRLFISRAEAVKADFTVDDGNAAAIVEISHLLDGLPLAIELAAPRIRLLTLQALQERLERRLPMLTGGARDAPERQRTLRDTIAWSYDLLEPGEQTLFHRLAVFIGGATYEAVEAVGNRDGRLDAFSSLEQLVEHSLVRRVEGSDDELRFVMLETIREFATERLAASGEDNDVRDAHAHHYATLGDDVRRAFTLRPVPWQRELRAEAGNLHAALAWMHGRGDPETHLRLALAAHYLAVHRGGLAEVRAWLERILPEMDATSRLSATGFAALGWESLLLRDTHAAAAAGAKSMAAAEAAQDEVGIGYGAWIYATALDDLGETEQAARLYDRVFTIGRRATQTGDPVGARLAVDGLGQLAFLAERRGDSEEAAEMYAEAIAFGRSQGVDPTHWSSLLLSLSVIARKRGDDRRAAQLLSEAIPLFSDRGNLGGLASSIEEVAQCALTLKRARDAARLLGVAAAIDEQMGIPTFPEDAAERDRLVALVRARLSQEAYAAAMVEGRAMTTQVAVAEALALTEALAPDRPRTGTIQASVGPI